MIKYSLIEGDTLQSLKGLEDNSVDAIVSDPPYGLKFMGKKWDYTIPSVAVYKECLRVLKAGGHMLIACGTRTQHRMAVNIEDAGFEIRDVITWHYGSGFPKSSKQAEGWGTALKPATEFWTLCRKPLESTVAENVLKHGTGGINIDGCRIETEDNLNGGAYSKTDRENTFFKSLDSNAGEYLQPQGRFPANLILDPYTAELLDEQSGERPSGKSNGNAKIGEDSNGAIPSIRRGNLVSRDDSGGASRFFYVAKPSKKERNAGLDFENKHPTVKPIALMRYLIRLITPKGGVLLDMYNGSGTTGCAAALETDLTYIGIDNEPEYIAISHTRIKHWTKKNGFSGSDYC